MARICSSGRRFCSPSPWGVVALELLENLLRRLVDEESTPDEQDRALDRNLAVVLGQERQLEQLDALEPQHQPDGEDQRDAGGHGHDDAQRSRALFLPLGRTLGDHGDEHDVVDAQHHAHKGHG